MKLARFGNGSHALLAALALCTAACGGDGGSIVPAPTPLGVFAAPPTAAPPSPPASPRVEKQEPLPRQAAGATLGMSRAEAERVFDELTCRKHPAGYLVCAPAKQGRNGEGVQLYLYHGRVIAVVHPQSIPGDVWTFLDGLISRYGQPSLNGMTDEDHRGRLHEIYGWKDDESLYSVRFIWVKDNKGARHLTATMVTLWDRAAYAQWKNDPKRLKKPRKSPPRNG